VAGLTLVVGAVGATVMPADAATWWQNRTTTTTKATTTTSTTEPSTTSTVALADGDCGATIKKADGTPWVCTLADNFNGTTLNRDLWFVQTSAASGFGSGDDCFLDDPDNVSVSGGSLKLTVRREAAPFTCTTPKTSYTTQYSSGTINTYTKWSQAFGRFEFRAKFPAATKPGLHGALWMWPDNPVKYGAWPRSGEIDVAEVYSKYNDRAIPYIHYLPGRSTQTNNYCTLDVTGWHTYVVEWTTKTIKVTFDGVVCVNETIKPAWPMTAPAPFDQPFMLALTEGLGVGANALDPAAPPEVPATMQVDYVHVWK
jgi:beta-glucanase (GH16 family)